MKINTDFNNSNLDDNLDKPKNPTDTLSIENQEIRFNQLMNNNIELDIKLKKTYAIALFFVMCVQIAATNSVLVFTGLNKLHFDSITLNIFIGSTTVEIIGLVYVITRSLFKK